MYAVSTPAGSFLSRYSPGHPQPDVGPGSQSAGHARWPRSPGGGGRDPGPGLFPVPITYRYALGDG